MNIDLLLDGFIAVFGVYLIYCAIKMKRTGELTPGIMVRGDTDLSHVKDLPGFIKYMYGKTVAIGICTVICGGVGIFNDLHGGLGMLQIVMTGVFFVVVVLFGIITMKAQKKYLGI